MAKTSADNHFVKFIFSDAFSSLGVIYCDSDECGMNQVGEMLIKEGFAFKKGAPLKRHVALRLRGVQYAYQRVPEPAWWKDRTSVYEDEV